MLVQIHCVHSPLVVETDFILSTPQSNSIMQNHPPESPTSTRPCPKLILSDGTWATSQHDIAVEWVSLVEKRHAGSTSTPHQIISDADRSAGHFARVSLVPSLVPSPNATSPDFCQAAALQIEEDLLPAELFKFLPVPLPDVFHPPRSRPSPRPPNPWLGGAVPRSRNQRCDDHRPLHHQVPLCLRRHSLRRASATCVSRPSPTWRSPGSRPCATTSPCCRTSPTSGIPMLHPPLPRVRTVGGHRPVFLLGASSKPSNVSYAGLSFPPTQVPPVTTHLNCRVTSAPHSFARRPFHAAVHAHAAPSRVANALHGTCCSNRLTQHWTRSRMLKHPRYSQRCDHSIIDFVTAPAGDKSSKTGPPASLPAPHLPPMRVHGPMPLWANCSRPLRHLLRVGFVPTL